MDRTNKEIVLENTNHPSPRVFRLDNAALVYPAVRGSKNPNIFRISADLVEEIDPHTLQQALDASLRRMPNFSVKLRSGFFWHYFVTTNKRLLIQPDVSNPCTLISDKENDGFQIRVRYHHTRIALEIFHSITDGAGALLFLKTLIGKYLMLNGKSIPAENGILDTSITPGEDEMRDAFHQFAGEQRVHRGKPVRAYHVTGTPLPAFKTNIITGIISIHALREHTKPLGVTITEYLTAVLMGALQANQQDANPRHILPIRVQVPVDLRRFVGSKTFRNFSSFITPSIEPKQGHFQFDEILHLVHHFTRYHVTRKYLSARVANNIKTERILFLRVMPLILKNWLISLSFKMQGPRSYTSTISNLGRLDLPKEFQKWVRSFDFILGYSQDIKVKCAVLGYKENLHINFTRSIKEANVEREFFTHFVKRGIPVRVENY